MADYEAKSRLEAISTRWSLLRRAHDGLAATMAGEARQALVLRYIQAIERYVGALLQHSDEAADVAQDVVVRLLAGNFANVDPQRGRFRDFLKTAIRNTVRNQWNQQKRRRKVDFDVAQLPDEDEADEKTWESQWRTVVLDLAWRALEQYQQSHSGSVAYTVMRLRVDHPDDTSEQLAVRLSQATGRPVRPETLRQRLHRARDQFTDLLIAEVAKGLADPTPDKIEDELVALGLTEYLPAEWKQRES
jgi:RNA polymerase sigma-70 factor (ECF subfamily)